MATEEGIVVQIHNKLARVKTTQSSSCKACSARGACHVTENGKSVEVEAINHAGAKEGDRILLHFETASLLKACFLLYILPVCCMLAGAILGNWLALTFGLNTSLTAAVIGFLALAVSFAAIRSKANRLGTSDAYKPKIIRVLNHQPAN